MSWKVTSARLNGGFELGLSEVALKTTLDGTFITAEPSKTGNVQASDPLSTIDAIAQQLPDDFFDGDFTGARQKTWDMPFEGVSLTVSTAFVHYLHLPKNVSSLPPPAWEQGQASLLQWWTTLLWLDMLFPDWRTLDPDQSCPQITQKRLTAPP
eukprot:1160541-Pelagomonas_calceolata.AAC.7